MSFVKKFVHLLPLINQVKINSSRNGMKINLTFQYKFTTTLRSTTELFLSHGMFQCFYLLNNLEQFQKSCEDRGKINIRFKKFSHRNLLFLLNEQFLKIYHITEQKVYILETVFEIYFKYAYPNAHPDFLLLLYSRY